MVHVAIREQKEMPVHSKKQAQVGALLFDRALTKVPTEYSNHSNIFLLENASKFPENTGINKYVIELKKGN